MIKESVSKNISYVVSMMGIYTLICASDQLLWIFYFQLCLCVTYILISIVKPNKLKACTHFIGVPFKSNCKLGIIF